MALMKGQTTHCIYCSGSSDFIVKLRDSREKIVGMFYVCENCRHMIVRTRGADLHVHPMIMISTHLSDVPPVMIDSNN